MFTTVEVSFQGAVFDKTRTFSRRAPLSAYQAVFGDAERSLALGNVVHVYDRQGLYLLQDSRSGDVRSITFVLEPKNWLFQLAAACSVELRVFGLLLQRGLTEGQLKLGDRTPLRRFLPGVWSGKEGGVYICIDTKRRETATGARTRARYVVSATVSFLA